MNVLGSCLLFALVGLVVSAPQPNRRRFIESLGLDLTSVCKYVLQIKTSINDLIDDSTKHSNRPLVLNMCIVHNVTAN